jgi:hypothetical protein
VPDGKGWVRLEHQETGGSCEGLSTDRCLSVEAIRKRTIDSLRQVLEAAGVEFTNGRKPGVRVGIR